MKILITGFSGFVSRHFVQYLYDNNINAEILGIDVAWLQFDYTKFSDRINIDFVQLDLLNKFSLM